MAGINEDNRESKRTGQITTFSRSQRNQLRYPEIYRGIVSYCLFLPTIESNATAGKKRRATAKEAKATQKQAKQPSEKASRLPARFKGSAKFKAHKSSHQEVHPLRPNQLAVVVNRCLRKCLLKKPQKRLKRKHQVRCIYSWVVSRAYEYHVLICKSIHTYAHLCSIHLSSMQQTCQTQTHPTPPP